MLVRHRSPLFRGIPDIFAFDRSFGSFDRAFEQLTQSFFDTHRRLPVVDSSWADGSLVLSVDLPGVPSEAVTVEVAGRELRIAIDTEELKWERTMTLGGGLDPEKVSARHVDGRLTVTVGGVAAAERRPIAIDTTPAPQAIESGTTTAEATDAVEAAGSGEEVDQSTGTSSTD